MARTCRRYTRAAFRNRSIRWDSEAAHFYRVQGTITSTSVTERSTHQVLRTNGIIMCTANVGGEHKSYIKTKNSEEASKEMVHMERGEGVLFGERDKNQNADNEQGQPSLGCRWKGAHRSTQKHGKDSKGMLGASGTQGCTVGYPEVPRHASLTLGSSRTGLRCFSWPPAQSCGEGHPHLRFSYRQ